MGTKIKASSEQIDIKLFRELTKKLTAKDIIELTYKAVTEPIVEIVNIHCPGYVYKGKAYGGAGTNAIAYLMKLKSPIKHLSWGLPDELLKRSFVVPMYQGYQIEELYGRDYQHLHYFDWMICYLAKGRVEIYNMWAEFIQMPLLTELEIPFPISSEISTKELLTI